MRKFSVTVTWPDGETSTWIVLAKDQSEAIGLAIDERARQFVEVIQVCEVSHA